MDCKLINYFFQRINVSWCFLALETNNLVSLGHRIALNSYPGFPEIKGESRTLGGKEALICISHVKSLKSPQPQSLASQSGFCCTGIIFIGKTDNQDQGPQYESKMAAKAFIK